MEKYIRTDNGIYDTSKGIYTPSIKMYAIGTETIYEKDIINQANTIKELIDEFVYIEYKKPRVLDRVITREIKEKGIKVAETIYCHPNWNGIIYGAIWTDKGLIYVAKMNEKGELELI